MIEASNITVGSQPTDAKAEDTRSTTCKVGVCIISTEWVHIDGTELRVTLLTVHTRFEAS